MFWVNDDNDDDVTRALLSSCFSPWFWTPDSAVIEHTNRVIFLEDDDIAAVSDGRLSIHRIKRRVGDHPARAIQTLQMELQQIMKGETQRNSADTRIRDTDPCSGSVDGLVLV